MFPQRDSLTFFQPQAMECFCKLGLFLQGGGLFSEASGTLKTVAGGYVTVSLGLGAALGLNLFVGTALFLFSTVLSFLTLGFVSMVERVCIGYWQAEVMGPIFLSTSRKVFIFLIIVGWGQSPVLHGVYFISCIVLSLLKICVPCMEVIFTSISTTSTRSRHVKYLCRKLHSG